MLPMATYYMVEIVPFGMVAMHFNSCFLQTSNIPYFAGL